MLTNTNNLNSLISNNVSKCGPTVIGSYRLGKTLGEGTYSKVKCTSNFTLNHELNLVGINDINKERVAIKMVRKNLIE